MKIYRPLVVALLLLLLACPSLADERVFVPTEDWVPPVIDESVKDTEPWLLVLKIAQEEIGYTEGPLKDQSKYGEWYAGKRVAWCAEFLTWCVNEADTRYGTQMLRSIYPMYGKSKEGAPWFVARGRFVTDDDRIPVTHEKQWLVGDDHYLENNEYIPYPGDYLWISYYSPEKGTDHVAIVEGVSVDPDGELQVHVIEGNNPDKVQRNMYAVSYKLIYGYGTPVRRANTDVGLYDTCDDIFVYQSFLRRKGYLTEKGQYAKQISRKMVEAMRRYQKDNGLRTSGMLDLATRTFAENDPDFQAAVQEVFP
ncbi:MAG: CHAP domain-containing protein [Clostridia bacterium]|nr:CHAP domain-containing protein [Clostridia bacterium]